MERKRKKPLHQELRQTEIIIADYKDVILQKLKSDVDNMDLFELVTTATKMFGDEDEDVSDALYSIKNALVVENDLFYLRQQGKLSRRINLTIIPENTEVNIDFFDPSQFIIHGGERYIVDPDRSKPRRHMTFLALGGLHFSVVHDSILGGPSKSQPTFAEDTTLILSSSLKQDRDGFIIPGEEAIWGRKLMYYTGKEIGAISALEEPKTGSNHGPTKRELCVGNVMLAGSTVL